jgi:hypothetical protein
MADSTINRLFVDLNSYFASTEQELCPKLRGQPIAIVPIRIKAQTGCCIAVSGMTFSSWFLWVVHDDSFPVHSGAVAHR